MDNKNKNKSVFDNSNNYLSFNSYFGDLASKKFNQFDARQKMNEKGLDPAYPGRQIGKFNFPREKNQTSSQRMVIDSSKEVCHKPNNQICNKMKKYEEFNNYLRLERDENKRSKTEFDLSINYNKSSPGQNNLQDFSSSVYNKRPQNHKNPSFGSLPKERANQSAHPNPNHALHSMCQKFKSASVNIPRSSSSKIFISSANSTSFIYSSYSSSLLSSPSSSSSSSSSFSTQPSTSTNFSFQPKIQSQINFNRKQKKLKKKIISQLSSTSLPPNCLSLSEESKVAHKPANKSSFKNPYLKLISGPLSRKEKEQITEMLKNYLEKKKEVVKEEASKLEVPFSLRDLEFSEDYLCQIRNQENEKNEVEKEEEEEEKGEENGTNKKIEEREEVSKEVETNILINKLENNEKMEEERRIKRKENQEEVDASEANADSTQIFDSFPSKSSEKVLEEILKISLEEEKLNKKLVDLSHEIFDLQRSSIQIKRSLYAKKNYKKKLAEEVRRLQQLRLITLKKSTERLKEIEDNNEEISTFINIQPIYLGEEEEEEEEEKEEEEEMERKVEKNEEKNSDMEEEIEEKEAKRDKIEEEELGDKIWNWKNETFEPEKNVMEVSGIAKIFQENYL